MLTKALDVTAFNRCRGYLLGLIQWINGKDI